MTAILAAAAIKSLAFYGLLVAVILAAIFNARRQGKAEAQRQERWQDLADFRATRKVVDDESMDADPVAARKRLRTRNPGKP